MRLLNFLLLAIIIFPGIWISATIASKDKLVIGITQFPSTFHSNIDSMAAKSYIHAMTARPFTVFDKDWKLICMLCTKLPTIENGLAKKEKTPSGKKVFQSPIPFIRIQLGVMG